MKAPEAVAVPHTTAQHRALRVIITIHTGLLHRDVTVSTCKTLAVSEGMAETAFNLGIKVSAIISSVVVVVVVDQHPQTRRITNQQTR
jgi:hypothetical protein